MVLIRCTDGTTSTAYIRFPELVRFVQDLLSLKHDTDICVVVPPSSTAH